MGTQDRPGRGGLDRRQFLGWTAKRGVGLALVGGAVPTLLAACGSNDDDPAIAGAGGDESATTTSKAEATQKARAVVGDVVDFSLSPDGWEGAFGSVTMKLHKGAVDGNDVHFVRTDTSDSDFAKAEKLVFVPKLAGLSTPELSGGAYTFENGASGQPTVFSSEPGRDNYTPAWTLHRVSWSGSPRLLGSVAEIEEAQRAGAVTVERTDVVVNYGLVKWSNGSMAVDKEKKEYLGEGQLLEEPDTSAGRVTFKLSQCYPGNRYFVLDHSMAPMAEMTSTNFSPRLHDGPTKAGATGRTNVFMNGVKGPGPMGFQPSVFDFSAGDSAWSPYWDHFAYSWKASATPKLFTSQSELFKARDAGQLEEFPGVPDTKGAIFTVNCPVPVLAPNDFTPA